MALALALAAVVLAGPVGPSAAEPGSLRAPFVSAVDAAGDVTIRDVPGPGAGQRRSIDLLGVKVVPREDGLVRFAFRIAEVTSSPRFDQLLTVALVDAQAGAERTAGRLSLRVQHTRSGFAEGSVDTDTEGSGAACLSLPVVVTKVRGLVKLDVDPDCLPPGEVSIRVKAFTTTPKGQRRTMYSRDVLRVPGSHDLGGLVGSDDPH